MKYAFDHSGGRHELGLAFSAPNLTVGGAPQFSFVRPFGVDIFYQAGTVATAAEGFLVHGVICANDAGTQVEDLKLALTTCVKLYRTENDGSNEAYAECDGAAPPIVEPIKEGALKVILYFWATHNWLLSADDSEVLI